MFWYIFVSIAALVVYIGGLLVRTHRSRISKKREHTQIDSSQNNAIDEETDENIKMSEICDTSHYKDMYNGDDEYVMQTVEIS